MIKRLTLLLLVACLLAGCVRDHTTFYVACRKDGDVTYVTDGTNYFQQTELGLIKVPQDTMKPKPYLDFRLRKGEYKFAPTEIPTVYRATLTGLEIYINRLVETFGGTYDIEYADDSMVRGSFTSDSLSLRFVYTNPDYVRLYAIDNLKISIKPPYFNEDGI